MASVPVILSAALTFKHPKELKISKEVVDFGFCILQTPQLTSALHLSFSRKLAISMTILGLLACLTLFLAPGGIWLLLFGIFMWRHPHHVVMSGSDGRTYVIRTPNANLAIQIIERLRDVVTQPVDTPSYVINIKAQTIEARTLVDLATTSISGSHGAAIVKGDTPGPVATSAAVRTDGALPAAAHHPSVPTAPPGHAQKEGIAITGSPGASITTGTVHGSVSTNVSISTEISQSLDGLLSLIERNNVAHKEQLCQMLRYVQQQSAAGPAGVGKARETWASFAQYAVSYLSGVEGVMGFVDRIQRLLSR